MIELLVAMVLLAMAVAVVASIVVQALSGSSHSRAGSMADGAVARASSALADDVASATTADRRDDRLRDPTDLAAALRNNEVAISSDPAENGRRLDIDEVVAASPAELQLRADVDLRAGIECITWRASTTGGYELTRLVAAEGAPCGTGGISTTVMLRSSSPAAAGIDVTPFSYRLVCRQGACPGSAAAPARPCAPWTVDATVPTRQRRWVVGVDATLGTVSAERSPASSLGSIRASIRGRDTESYRRGLGC